MYPPELVRQAEAVLAAYRERGLQMATAESCTGGLISGVLTEVPGSSDVVDRGFVTYSNAAKSEALGVPADVIAANGAVSEPVARAMAEGAIRLSCAAVAVAVTGVAGPGGGTATKPVGLVHLAVARRDGPTVHRVCRFGEIGRTEIRMATVKVALDMLTDALAVSGG
jgi:nicotinamide-nucleotide amidase